MFYFHPYLGKIPILTNIFEMGWNHQLVINPYSQTMKRPFGKGPTTRSLGDETDHHG